MSGNIRRFIHCKEGNGSGDFFTFSHTAHRRFRYDCIPSFVIPYNIFNQRRGREPGRHRINADFVPGPFHSKTSAELDQTRFSHWIWSPCVNFVTGGHRGHVDDCSTMTTLQEWKENTTELEGCDKVNV